MTETAYRPETKATEAALNWLIVLQEEPEDAEIGRRFVLWLEADAAHKAAWAEARRLWAVLGDARTEAPALAEVPVQPRMAGASGMPVAPMPQVAVPPAGRMRGRIAAGVVALGLAVMAVAYLPGLMLRLDADHITGTGQTADITLADGSHVILDADSAIAVDFTPEGRQVRLLQGQAMFEVEPDAARPFRVTAAEMRVTVLGTGFDINLLPDGAMVSVAHGRVAVEGVEQPLGAGDWVWQGEGQSESGHIAPEMVGGWRQGMLIVKNRPVAEVAAVLRRYMDGSVTILGGELGRQRVTGVYDLTDPEASLEALRAAHGGRLRWLPGGMAIFSAS